MSERPVITTEDVLGCMECGIIFTTQVSKKCPICKKETKTKRCVFISG